MSSTFDARMLSLQAVQASSDGVLVYGLVRDHRNRIAAFRRYLTNPAATTLLERPEVQESLRYVLPERATPDLFERYVACASACRSFTLDKAVGGAESEGGLLALELDVRPREDGLVIVLRDATHRARMVRRLEQHLARLEHLARRSQDVLLLVTPSGSVRWASPTALSVFGRPPDGMVGLNLYDLLEPSSHRDLGPGGTVAMGQARVRTRGEESEARWLDLTVELDTDQKDRVVVVRDVTLVLGLQRRIAELDPDGLPDGVVPRRPFRQHLDKEVARRRRYGRPASVVALSIDGMADLDPETRARAQDRLVAASRSVLRTSDVLGHWSDDLYVLLLPETPAAGAVRACHRLAASFEAQPADADVPATLCAGVTALDADDDAKSSLRRAGRVLARARKHGRGTVLGRGVQQAA